MFGLTQLGVIHTAVSLIAVGAGLIALFRDKEISPRNGVGKIYIIATILTCLTGFGIFQHGGFGKPHALGRSFYEPTVLAEATPQMRCVTEEIFGPVAPVLRFASEDEAIELANASEAAQAALADVFARAGLTEVLCYGTAVVVEPE